MTLEALIARLIKIESLHAGATTDGERIASEEARKRILGRRPRHGDRALGQLTHVGLDVVARHHRLAAPDEYAQPHVVAFGALGFLHCAFAYLDRKRDRAHGERVGGVRAGAASRRDEPLGKVGQRGLVEQRGHRETLSFVRGSTDRFGRGALCGTVPERGKVSSSMSRIRAVIPRINQES